MRGILAVRYIFFETLPSFLLGVTVFISILLMFQVLRLTEFVLVHGVSLLTILDILLYLSVSFLPVILPMSLLFSILLTYSRLSMDSEVVAFKAIGHSMWTLSWPAIILGTVAMVTSAQTSFYLGPWGNRQFELLINDLGRQKMGATLKEGVFSEDFFDMVVYANKVDSNSGRLQDVFIYDEHEPKNPITIIAREGEVIQQNSPQGESALLRLSKGNIHKTMNNNYTKVDFETYDINLFNPIETSEKKKSTQSMTIDELDSQLERPDLKSSERHRLEIEYHRRWSLSATCLIFALLGVGLGTITNRRSSKGGGFVLCLVLLVSYWLLYLSAEGVSRSGWAPASVSLWAVNALFAAVAVWSLRRSWV